MPTKMNNLKKNVLIFTIMAMGVSVLGGEIAIVEPEFYNTQSVFIPEDFKIEASKLYEAPDYTIQEYPAPTNPYERKGFAFDPSDANLEKFRNTIRAMRLIKERGGDENLRMGGVMNALVSINKKYDYIDPHEAYREFFGGDIPLDQAEKRLDDIYDVTSDYTDYEFIKFLQLPACDQNKVISEYKERVEHKNKIERYKEIFYVALFYTLPLLIIIIAGCLLKKFLTITKGNPIPRLYALLSIFLLIASFIDSRDLFDGYYMLLRLFTSGVCLYSAVKFKTEWAKWIFGGLAVLYNPVLPIHLGDKDAWAVINLITIIYTWAALYFENKAKKA